MGFKTIKKSSAPDMVANQILQQIDNKAFLPGSQLPAQRELAEILGVGRSSIREAINALVVMGYLEPVQGRGTYVKQILPSSDERLDKLSIAFNAGSIFDLMEARVLLECESAALAAKRAEPRQIKKLKTILGKIPSADQGYDIFLRSDLQFHHAIAEATHNVVICEMTKLVLEKVTEHHSRMNTDQLSQSYKTLSIQTARGVLKAIEDGDSKTAAAWMGKHLGAIKDELSRVL